MLDRRGFGAAHAASIIAALCVARAICAADLYMRYTSSGSHGVPIYLRVERREADAKREVLGYISRTGISPKAPAKEDWLKPGQAAPWIAVPAPTPEHPQRFVLTCLYAAGPVGSYSMILDVAPRPDAKAIVRQSDDAHTVTLPVQGPQFKFAISMDERGQLKLELPASPVEQWLNQPDLPRGQPRPRFGITRDLITRKRIMLGTCGRRIDVRRADDKLRGEMRDLVDFYRGLSCNFVYNFYPHDTHPWQGDWPTTCRNIRHFLSLLNDAGIAGSQAVLGRWLSETAFRRPQERRLRENGRSASNQLCPRKSDVQRQVVAKLLRNLPLDGFHIEEPSTAMCYCTDCQTEFRRYLEAERARLPADFFFPEPLGTLRAPTQAERFERRDVWWHWFWFSLRSYRDQYCSIFAAARDASRETWGKDCLTMTSVGYSGVVLPMMGARHTDFLSHPAASGMLNALYWHCGEKVTVDSFKDYHLQASWCKSQSLGKPVWFYIVGKSSRRELQPWWFEAEVYDSLLAGLDGFIVWPPVDDRAKDIMPGIKRAFRFVADQMDCFAGVESCAQAAIAYNYDQTAYELFGTRYRAERSHPHFAEHFRAMFHVLSDLHVPADYVVPLTRKSLAPYRLLVLDELRCMTEEQTAAVLEWVRNGGSLLAMGDVSGCDLYERPRPAYPLADVLGVRAKSRKLESPSRLLLAQEPGILGNLAGQPIGYGSDLFIYWRFKYKRLDDGYAIDPGPGAKVLARWPDASAAVVANEFGKGRCVYCGPFLQFIPPAQRQELARALVSWLLRDELPVVCPQLPPECDVSVLRKGDRLFVHVLNLKEWRLTGDRYANTQLSQWTIDRATPIDDLRVTVALPPGTAPTRATLLSPDTPAERPIGVQIAEGRASFVVPRLDLYSVVVLSP